MMAHSLKVDTLSYANALKEVGMDSKQAEVLAELNAKLIEDGSNAYATKSDIEILKNELKAEISTKVSTLEATIIKWVVGISLDRKSTRLNSSHLVISYAVFCLKKKIKVI